MSMFRSISSPEEIRTLRQTRRVCQHAVHGLKFLKIAEQATNGSAGRECSTICVSTRIPRIQGEAMTFGSVGDLSCCSS